VDRLIEIATFVKVVEAGGFSAASRKLGMSPSTVTTHIQDLEQQLGARLLNRTTRKISLTDVGKEYYDRCLQILADVDEATDVVQALQSTPRGTLRVNVSVVIPQLVAPAITEFTSLYPDVRVSVIMTDRMVDMIEEGIEVAIRLLPIPDSSLIIRRIGSFRVQVWGSPAYFEVHGYPREPSDLAKHNCLRYSFSPWGEDWKFDREDSEETIRISGNMESNSLETLKLAALHGQGLILTPGFAVADEVKRGQLIPVLTEFVRTEHAINAIYPHRLHLSAKVRAFLDLAAKYCRSATESQAATET
jgi:DNA-binding transcriptional LysR family regulator